MEVARPVRGRAGETHQSKDRQGAPVRSHLANTTLDECRRRVHNETLGHRGRNNDPLHRIRKLLLKGSERLNQRGSDRMLLGLRIGDPSDEVLGAWLAKEFVRDIYLTDQPDEATTLIDKAIAGCLDDDVDEIRTLGR